MGHYDHRTFSLTAYQNMGKLQNGDMSWVIPGKFIAFSGPLSK
jgi:cell division cycle 14